MTHQLKIEGVMKAFGQHQLLSGLAFTCNTGDIIGILGRNGCGKSTLLKIIFGTEHTYDKNIQINGHPCPTPYQKGNQLAYLPQQGFLPTHLSLKQIIRLVIPSADKRNYIYKHERIQHHLTKKITQLSGGERRFFEVLLLVNRAVKFVLLDEPFSGIEPLYKTAIQDLLNDYRDELGFIITDHDYESILKAADQVLLIKDGSLIPIRQLPQLEQHNYVPDGTFTKADQQDSEQNHKPFEVDSQTLRDLDLLNNKHPGLIMQLFNRASSEGGQKKIHDWMTHPHTNGEKLTNRRNAIRFFHETGLSLDFPTKKMEFVLHYLNAGIVIQADNPVDILIQYIKEKIHSSNDYFLMTEGVKAVIRLLNYLLHFTQSFNQPDIPYPLKQLGFKVTQIEKQLLKNGVGVHLSIFQITKLHNHFNTMGEESLKELIDIYYQLGALQAIGTTAKKLNLCYSEYLDSETSLLELTGLFHPLIDHAVSNDFSLYHQQHLCFLTGANMSGKSTFMKALALSVYLAHLGFPVPAKHMKLSILNGLMTTINLSDNILQGYSHFYSEVRRVREAAERIKESKKVLVLFDELFKGTNVKDAADASLLVTKALAQIPNSLFVVSTHIVEIAEDLKTLPGVRFNCFEACWNNNTPEYDYLLKAGISSERLGMYIVEKEGIMEVLEAAKHA
ncbi:MAG: ATP-binding cassette domain-containing protein [Marinilabiliaceae bacterium]|nr:ATP-binding cassette domain-containing protein [Marinilabiliaceae bacterium]